MTCFLLCVDQERSLKLLELHFDSIQGENPIFSRFDFNTINIATTNFSDANMVDDGYYSIMYKVSMSSMFLLTYFIWFSSC